MKRAEIKVGGHYLAKVSNKLTTVRVDAREDCPYGQTRSYKGRGYTIYYVTNLKTGRATTFRSAAKFRREVVHPCTNS